MGLKAKVEFYFLHPVSGFQLSCSGLSFGIQSDLFLGLSGTKKTILDIKKGENLFIDFHSLQQIESFFGVRFWVINCFKFFHTH